LGGSGTSGTDSVDGSGFLGKDIAFVNSGDSGSAPETTVTEQWEQDVFDSVRVWFNAFSEKKQNAYLSHYSRNSFRFDGGGYTQWKEYVRKRFSLPSDNQSIVLDTIRHISSDGISVEVMVEYHVNTPSDTLDCRVALTWSKGTEGWRIIREEQLAASTRKPERE
jgi:hypothetical protein